MERVTGVCEGGDCGTNDRVSRVLVYGVRHSKYEAIELSE